MLMVGCLSIGWIPDTEQKHVGMMLMAFVFPLELIATVFAFLSRDTLGATTLGLFATSWLTLGWLDSASPPGKTSISLGIYLFGFATVAFLLAVMSSLGKPFFTVLLLVAVTRMVLGGYYEIGGTTSGRRSQVASQSLWLRSHCTAAPLSASKTPATGSCCRCSGAARPTRHSQDSRRSSSGSSRSPGVRQQL